MLCLLFRAWDYITGWNKNIGGSFASLYSINDYSGETKPSYSSLSLRKLLTYLCFNEVPLQRYSERLDYLKRFGDFQLVTIAQITLKDWFRSGMFAASVVVLWVLKWARGCASRKYEQRLGYEKMHMLELLQFVAGSWVVVKV